MKSTLKRKTGISPTASRIAQASLQLFNQQGERNVTTNHIARHLAMSTGNLYYHFSSKEDIIQALYQSYGDRMAWLLAEADARRHSLEELVVVLDAVLQHQWDYRFLLQSSASLFPFNAQLRASYQKFEVEQIAVGIESLFLKLREDGLFEGSVAAIRMLAVHFQLLQAAWIAHPERAGQSAAADQVVEDGRRQLLAFLRPHIAPSWQAAFERVASASACLPALVALSGRLAGSERAALCY